MTKNTISEECEIPKDNNEISINYVMTGKRWNRTHVIIDNIFAYNVALDIISENEDLEPKSVEECRHRRDWLQWKEAIEEELNSLSKRQVFGPVVRTPEGVKPVGYKWVFVRKKMILRSQDIKQD